MPTKKATVPPIIRNENLKISNLETFKQIINEKYNQHLGKFVISVSDFF